MKKKYTIPDSSNLSVDVLIDAVINGASVQEIEKLLDMGIDVNACSDDDLGRTTPLHCAVFNGDVAMVRFLFEHGASAKIRDDFGDTAFDCLPIVFSPHQAESVAEIMQLFVQYSDQSDFVSGYPLHKAASHGNVERVQFLIDQNVDVNMYNGSMHTALHYAVGRQQYDVVALLLENGADVTLVDSHNKTPFDWALDMEEASRNNDILELLKKYVFNGDTIITCNFSDKERLEIEDPWMPKGLIDYTCVRFVGVDRSVILVDDVLICCCLYKLRNLLTKALNNQLQLDELITKDIGFIDNEVMYYGNDLYFRAGKEWFGQDYLWVTTDELRPGLSSWIYNNKNGDIVFEITPCYQKRLIADSDYISYEDWIKDYRPYALKIVSRDLIKEWILIIDQRVAQIDVTVHSYCVHQ